MYSTTEPPSSPSWSPRAAAVLLAPRVVESWTPSGRFRAELRLVVRRSAGAAAFVAVVFAVCGAYLNGVMADFSGQDVVPARLAGAGIGALVGVGLVGAVALAMLVVRALVAGVQAVLARPTRSGRRAR
jgi:hypothetical protein